MSDDIPEDDNVRWAAYFLDESRAVLKESLAKHSVDGFDFLGVHVGLKLASDALHAEIANRNTVTHMENQ